MKVKVAQWCPSLCNPMDYTVHGILQARILEWVAFLFPRRSSQPRDQTRISLFCILHWQESSWPQHHSLLVCPDSSRLTIWFTWAHAFYPRAWSLRQSPKHCTPQWLIPSLNSPHSSSGKHLWLAALCMHSFLIHNCWRIGCSLQLLWEGQACFPLDLESVRLLLAPFRLCPLCVFL